MFRRSVLFALMLIILLSGIAVGAEYGTLSASFYIGYYLRMDYTSPYSSRTDGVVGQIIADYSNMNPAMNLSSSVFCVDPQNTNLGSLYNYSVVDADEIPNAGPGPMGAEKAEYLSELWGRFNSQINSNVAGAAFQLSVWEIVYDNQQTNFAQWDTSSGAFYASGNTDAINLANSWLSQLNGQGPKETLYGLSSSSFQDFIVDPVPEPSALTALGLSTLSLAGLILRKRR